MVSDVHELAQLVNDTGMGIKSAYKAGLLPASDKTVTKQLKNAGYVYDSATKKWILKSNIATTDDTKTELLPAPHVMLNNDELSALKQLAQQLIHGHTDITVHKGDAVELYERTRNISKSERDRKTYVIGKPIIKQFDELAARVNLDKSELIELALIDFLQRYNNA